MFNLFWRSIWRVSHVVRFRHIWINGQRLTGVGKRGRGNERWFLFMYSIPGILNTLSVGVLDKVHTVKFSLPILTVFGSRKKIWLHFIYPEDFFTVMGEDTGPVSLLVLYRHTERTGSDFTRRLHQSKPAPFVANDHYSENGLWGIQCSSSSEKVGENQECASTNDHAKW